jgi:hypothetical protein
MPLNVLDKSVAPAIESARSAVSFSAIFAGALAMASSSLVLSFVAAGMGFAVATPWSGAAAAATKFAATTAIALVVIQWFSSAVGGYIAGRLRVKWAAVHDDVIFFEDTAHGFLAWSVAMLAAAFLFASALSAGVHGLASAVTNSGQVVQSAASAAVPSLTGQVDYWTDELLRSPQATASPGDAHAELARIFGRGLTGDIPQADRDYAAQVVAARAGVDPAEAKKRVDSVMQQIDEAKQSATARADETRKTTATTSLMTALALVVGAFIASAAAALGGRLRDE